MGEGDGEAEGEREEEGEGEGEGVAGGGDVGFGLVGQATLGCPARSSCLKMEVVPYFVTCGHTLARKVCCDSDA